MLAIWAISHLCVVSEADLSIKADTWITTSTISQLGSALRLPWNGLNAGAVKLKCFPQQAETFRKCFHLKFSVCQLRETKNIKYLVLDVRGRSLSADCFCHKYRKAIHEWGHNTTRRDQSSIFGGKILGLHFQTLSLILLLIGKAFTDTDTRLIWKRINTPAAINRYQPNKSFQMESLWPHILKLDRAESLNLNW